MPPKLKAGQRRSQTEREFEAGLNKRGYTYEYEPKTFTMIPELTGTLGKISKTTYTPDFKIMKNNKVIWIEVKGFARGADHLKFKLADWYFQKKGEEFLVCGIFGTLKRGTKGTYSYSAKRQISRIEKQIDKGKKPDKLPESFWTVLEEVINR